MLIVSQLLIMLLLPYSDTDTWENLPVSAPIVGKHASFSSAAHAAAAVAIVAVSVISDDRCVYCVMLTEFRAGTQTGRKDIFTDISTSKDLERIY